MTKTNSFLCSTLSILLLSCSSTKNVSNTPSAPLVQRVPAKFDFSPPSRAKVGSQGITIAMVKPMFVGGEHPEYYVPPFNEMAARMATDFDELLTAKGFTIRGPYGSRDEMTYETKINSSFIMEINIELNPQFNQHHVTTAHAPSFGEIILNKNAPTTYSTKTSGEVTFAGNLVIKAKSAQYGELLWTKSIALESTSFTYIGQMIWDGVPTIADELNKDNQVYNTISIELGKVYNKALSLAWQQIDPAEMKTVAEQGKRADRRGS